jgi:hypothetical protein
LRKRFLLCAFCVVPSLAASQDQKAPTPQPQIALKLPDDFLSLADLRATTNSAIANLEKEDTEIAENKLPRAEATKARITRLKNIVSNLQDKSQKSDRDLSTLKEARAEVSYLEGDPSLDPQRLLQRKGEIQELLKSKRNLALEIQKKIVSYLSPEESFRKTMSEVFAGLIAAVIAGFFVIALRDERIRQAIFSGETGIQFLTLFSLVIAIILFGITRVLEGKELSALLGGLSGYILGRTTPKA